MKLLTTRLRCAASAERGVAMVMVAVTLVGLFAVSLAMWSGSLAVRGEQRVSLQRMSTQYAAEAALSAAFVAHTAAPDALESGNLGSEEAPIAFGEVNYWVERTTPGAGLVSLLATATDGRSASAVELVLQRQIDAFHVWGAFGDELLDMSSNSRVDSYDSRLGTYLSQALNGSGSDLYASTNGDVGSNANIVLSQNSKVWGDVTPGETGTALVLGNAVVSGSTAPAAEKFEFEELVIPTFGDLGALTVPNSGSATLPAGDIEYTNVVVGKQSVLTLTGPARVVMNNFRLESGGAVVIDATNGPVEFYVREDFIMRSNSQMGSTTSTPKDLKLYLQSDNIINPDLIVDVDDLDFQSNSKLFGTVFAPRAHIDINSNFELFGSLIARRVTLRSNSLIHFDEALMFESESEEVVYEVVAWLTRPARP